MEHSISIISGNISHIPLLVRHHRLMFEEIYQSEGAVVDRAAFARMDRCYQAKLESQMPDSICLSWLALVNGVEAASGALTFASLVPTPIDPVSGTAHLHSIFTERPYRRRGCSRLIVQTMIDHCRAAGVRRMLLNASNPAKPLYESLGFKLSSNSMSLVFEEPGNQ